MDYYKILNFNIEPFSNSPDPGLFYNSPQHLEILQKLEISIRLKRGLNIITGDIGTGKTTISRQLIQKISNDDSMKFYLVLDPGFSSPLFFLKYILHLFDPEKRHESNDETILKETIKEHIFTYGVDKNINIILIIDEGQKLSLQCIEVLRELLNFETNNEKLLQIIILAQKEFNISLEQIANFKDRINFYFQLNPLSFKESKNLINFRLEKSSINGQNKILFTPLAYFLIYRATKGFPRKIIMLCHQIMLSLIIKDKTKAGFFIVRSCIKQVFPDKSPVYQMVRPGFIVVFLIVLISGSLYALNDNKILLIFDQFSHFNQKPVNLKMETKRSLSPLKTEELFDKQKKENQNSFGSTSEIKTNINTPENYHGVNQAAFQKPSILGSIPIPENATLAKMMRIIYGSFRYSYLNKLIKYNAGISDPNIVKAGTNIIFPVIDSSNYYNDKKFFIILFETYNFEKSFNTAISYQGSDFSVRILPVWRNDTRFFFPVVLNKPFISLSAADKYKKSLPEIIFAECKSVSQIKNSIEKHRG